MKHLKGIIILTLSLFALSCRKNDNPISSNGEACEGQNGTLSASGRWREFNTSNSCLPHNTIRFLAIDHRNTVWIGTDEGLACYNGDQWTIYNRSNSGIPANGVWSLACEEDTVWIGFSKDGGLARFDRRNWTVYNSTNSSLGEILALPGSGPLELYITTITIDSKHNVWVGTNAEGLYKFDRFNWIRYYPTFKTPISSPAIRSIDIDDQDIVWIGHAEPAGVDRFDGNNWTNYTPENSLLPYWSISDIHADKMNIKWFATPFGLAGFDDINWTVYDTSNSAIPDENIYTIFSDSRNNLWVGTFSGALFTNKNSEWTTYYMNDASEPAQPYNTINCVVVDQDGNKWLGTYNGLYKFNENGLRN
jgi:ligand-binding sensor domain-containing protein